MTLPRSLFSLFVCSRRQWLQLLLRGGMFAILIQSGQIMELRHIRELTAAAWNILHHHAHSVDQGEKSMEQAQLAAIADLRDFRYGRENKDYVWITDHHPRMIMHPYVTELEGQDLSELRDPTVLRRSWPLFRGCKARMARRLFIITGSGKMMKVGSSPSSVTCVISNLGVGLLVLEYIPRTSVQK